MGDVIPVEKSNTEKMTKRSNKSEFKVAKNGLKLGENLENGWRNQKICQRP